MSITSVEILKQAIKLTKAYTELKTEKKTEDMSLEEKVNHMLKPIISENEFLAYLQESNKNSEQVPTGETEKTTP